MKVMSFILHLFACVLLAISPKFGLPYEFAIMVECFAIYHKID